MKPRRNATRHDAWSQKRPFQRRLAVDPRQTGQFTDRIQTRDRLLFPVDHATLKIDRNPGRNTRQKQTGPPQLQFGATLMHHIGRNHCADRVSSRQGIATSWEWGHAVDRRAFSQLVTFGAAAITVGQTRADDGAAAQQPDTEDAAPRPGAPPDGKVWSTPPVNVNDFVVRAQAELPIATFEYITSGSEDEITLRDNVEAFRRIRLLPPLLHGVNQSNLSTTVLGQAISMPVLLAPVAALRMAHPEGARASARAAAAAG